MRGGATRAAMRVISSSGVRCSSSTLAPRLSLPGAPWQKMGARRMRLRKAAYA